jgi:hypothetical protein
MIELTIDVRILRALSLISSRDETRFILCGIHLEADKEGITYVATDGRRMMAVRQKGEQLLREPVAFTIRNYMADMVSMDDVNKRAMRFLYFDGETVRLQPKKTTDLTVQMPVLAGDYPKWRSVIPRGELKPVATPCFNATFLQTYARAACLLHGNKPTKPKGMFGSWAHHATSLWSVNGDNTATMLVKASSLINAPHESVALLMPIRADQQHEAPPVPDWTCEPTKGLTI